MKTWLPHVTAILWLSLAPAASGADGFSNDAAVVRAVEVGVIGLTVSDLDRAVEFYTRILSFAPDGHALLLIEG